ncbi:hypothetical protein F3Y22_tig00110797pilonHSYRG00005 [Hibiscus syriacus]|uniref:RNA polymerase sigma-70 region 2 domain-containing protein n=1 Tax=Hibiscus syriacus TaxID=106335 RepID=A0A6A2ZQH9_HIBSY|nr:hypothetical protein F3Y22_tig00110797pilonHSYRG00005 [Hibiscus syriacus]
MGFRLNLKSVLPVPSHFLANSPSRLPSSSVGMDVEFWRKIHIGVNDLVRSFYYGVHAIEFQFTSPTRLSFLPVISDEGLILSKDPLKAYASSGALQTLENGCLEVEEKVKIDKGSQFQSCSSVMIVKSNEQIGGNKSSWCTSLQICSTTHYGVLMENLNILEETLVDSDVQPLPALCFPKQVITNLERIRTIMEEEPGKVVSMSCGAEAAKLTEKVLKQHLCYGWCCRDELLRSTRSLVPYFTRNYWGLGIAHEDLIQAGSIGVLQGAEKFDHTRGYKLATHIQHWIRKSISRMVARHARRIQVLVSMDDGFGMLPITLLPTICICILILSCKLNTASMKMLRLKICVEYTMMLELIPDVSIGRPEKTVMRQHMKEDIHGLLNDLEKREASDGSPLRGRRLSPEVTRGDRKAFRCEQRVD